MFWYISCNSPYNYPSHPLSTLTVISASRTSSEYTIFAPFVNTANLPSLFSAMRPFTLRILSLYMSAKSSSNPDDDGFTPFRMPILVRRATNITDTSSGWQNGVKCICSGGNTVGWASDRWLLSSPSMIV